LRKAVAKNESLADVEQIKVYSRSSELTIVVVEVQMPLTEGNVRNRCEQLDRNSKVVRQGFLNFLSWQP
jgi:hypothetical protein